MYANRIVPLLELFDLYSASCFKLFESRSAGRDFTEGMTVLS